MSGLAERVLRNALALVVTPEPVLRCRAVDVLEDLGGALVELEEPDEAVRLFAACSAARDEIGYRLRPTGRYDDDLERARSRCSERFAALWSEGAALTMEEAAAYGTRGRAAGGGRGHRLDGRA